LNLAVAALVRARLLMALINLSLVCPPGCHILGAQRQQRKTQRL